MLPSLNCAAFSRDAAAGMPEPAAAVTSPSFTSMTTRGSPASEGGEARLRRGVDEELSALLFHKVTFTGAAGPATEAARSAPRRGTRVTIRFPSSRGAHYFPRATPGARLPERLEVLLFLSADGHGGLTFCGYTRPVE
jgi:hypothetical protein